jgi:integrase
MNQHHILPFQRHLQAMGKRPSTVASYSGVLRRFLVWTDAERQGPPDAGAVYDFLLEQGNRPELSPQWYNVNYHALRLWLAMIEQPTGWRGLRPKQVPGQPPRWLTRQEVWQFFRPIEQTHFKMAALAMLATGLRVSEMLALWR